MSKRKGKISKLDSLKFARYGNHIPQFELEFFNNIRG